LYVIGELAGAPLLKLGMAQGERVAREIAGRLAAESGAASDWDVVVIGAGAAGLAAGLRLHELGRRVLVLDKSGIAATFQGFPEGKFIYAEPVDLETGAALVWEEGSKDAVAASWRRQVVEAGLPVGELAEVVAVDGKLGEFVVRTRTSSYACRYVVLAAGQRGQARRLGVRGEELAQVVHDFYSAKELKKKSVVVVGGGNTAAEAAIALGAANRVTLVHRGKALGRVSRRNQQRLAEVGVEIRLEAEVAEFAVGEARLKTGERLAMDHAVVLIGKQPDAGLIEAFGLRREGEWTMGRVLGLVVCLLLAYAIYGIKYGKGEEFWPFRGWGYEALSFGGRGWSFWYTVLYTAVVTVFGVQAMRRWGWARGDRYQIARYATLIGFQWTFFFLIPEFLFAWAVKYRWVGEALASDPNFAGNAWRSYGLVYAWPLFFYTFTGNPHHVWLIWGVVLSFVILPALVLLHGKRYCSWICGCGGLAETLGDRWRHLAPKGEAARRWERMNGWVLGAALLVSVLLLGQDVVQAFREPAGVGIRWYRLVVDTWLVGILPVGLYPFFGGKVWCRYWCPLAKLMEIWSSFYTRMRWSRFRIVADERCIACGECTRYCQVGIDVMSFALRREELTNANSSCIGCGICVSVCPMGVLGYGEREPVRLVQIDGVK
jgi:thioredoxin reductase/ferredoxin